MIRQRITSNPASFTIPKTTRNKYRFRIKWLGLRHATFVGDTCLDVLSSELYSNAYDKSFVNGDEKKLAASLPFTSTTGTLWIFEEHSFQNSYLHGDDKDLSQWAKQQTRSIDLEIKTGDGTLLSMAPGDYYDILIEFY
jgi:hypothetical protein